MSVTSTYETYIANLDSLQQTYLVFNGNGQSDYNAFAHAYMSAGIPAIMDGWLDGRELQTFIAGGGNLS
jgi:hypothetical protein